MSIISKKKGSIDMKTNKNILTEKEMELVQLLMAECKSTEDII